MSDTLTNQAIEDVKQRVANSFTVGGIWDGKTITGGMTYDRHWSNGWGLTAYARAWWDDKPVSVGMKTVKREAGISAVKTF